MKVVKIIGIVILLISIKFSLLAQEESYLTRMEQVFDTHEHKTEYASYIMEASNPLDFIFATLFVSYKVVLSSQDMGTCVFHPSCSVYGIQAIQKKGIIMGVISSFDRLTRCHPFASGNYIFDSKTNRMYDPVD